MTRHLPYDRAERVSDEIYQIISQAVLTELSDPRLAGVQVTRVRMTPDLRVLRVNFHTGGDEAQREAALAALKRAAGFLKRRIGKEINLRFMPEIEFFYDASVDTVERIADLLKAVNREP